MSNLSVALASARTYLNDDAASTWTDAALIPKLQEAHRELQTMLWENGSPAVRAKSLAITVSSLAVTISLPADLLTPFKLQEYAATVETEADAIDMTETIYLPNRVVNATRLIHWSWSSEAIAFVGCTAARKVIIYYRKSITVPSASGDPIGILFGELYLGARAAAIAHGSVGNKDAFQIISGFAKENFQKVVAAQRGQQTPPMKP